MKKCSKCLNDESVRNINFDENFVCNFCNNFEKLKPQLQDYDNLQRLFEERIEQVRGKYDYDAAVGISGGKDSFYVLHELLNKYNLKIKSFTMDNGFLTDEAKKNVIRIVNEYKIEHEFINFDENILKKFYKYSMKKWLTPCVACSYIGYASMINYASKVNAGMCIHGRTPEQMYRLLGTDVFTHFVEAGLKSIKYLDSNKLYAELLNSIGIKLDKNIMNDVKAMLFKDVKANDFREFVPYFLYHEYQEDDIVSYLEKNTSWKRAENGDVTHFDCKISKAAKYIYQCAEGRPHILPELSVLVRTGAYTKEECITKLEQHILKKPTKELTYLCKYVGVNKDILLLKAKIYNRMIKK